MAKAFKRTQKLESIGPARGYVGALQGDRARKTTGSNRMGVTTRGPSARAMSSEMKRRGREMGLAGF